jgi:CHAT domain-containing protein/Tfp pilus assembly protein PilF
MSPLTKTSSHWPRLLRTVFGLFVLTTLLFQGGVPCVFRAQVGGQTAAEKAFEEGEALFKQGSAESLRAAVLKYGEALESWRAANDRRGEVKAMLGIATAYYRLDEHQRALDSYDAALRLSRAAEDHLGEAQALNGMGNVCWARGDTAKARDYYGQSLAPRRAAGDRLGEAYTLANIGSAFWAEGEPRKALQYHSQTFDIMRDLADKGGMAFGFYNLGLTHASLSDHTKALDKYEQALALQRATGDRRAEAATLNGMGLVHGSLGENQKALDYYNQALPLRRAVGHRAGEAVTLRNIGDVYARLGETQKALEYYEEAIPLMKATGDRRGHAYTLDSIGVINWTLGEYGKALSNFDQALALFRGVGHKTGEATALEHIGFTHFTLGDNKKATEQFAEALSLFRAVGDRPGEARCLVKAGQVAARLDQPARAREDFEESLRVAGSIEDRVNEANALYEIALLERDQGMLEGAYEKIERARRLTEFVRAGVAAQELRASYLASVQDYYDLEIDILMRLHKERPSGGFDGVALGVSESSRARSLIETLNDSNVDIYEGVDARLVAEEHELQRRLSEKTDYQTRLLGGRRDDVELSATAREIEAIRTDYAKLRTRIKQLSPRYAGLTQPETLTVKQIQKQVLGPDTLLLEYTLGKERSFLWAVTPSSISSFELPKRAEVETVARQLYDSLVARNVRPSGETPEQRAKRLAQADEQYLKSSRALSDLLLAPVARELGNKRLLVVTEGALQYVPFAALPAPRREPPVKSGEDKEVHPLVLNHEIVSLPSASTLVVLRREASARAPVKKTLAVIADPVFEQDDSRVGRQAMRHKEGAEVAGGNNATGTTAADTVRRLVFSRDEAQAILSLVPPAQRRQALDFDASRAIALSPELGGYRLVHFATHAFIDTIHPERSGVLLSRVDASGGWQEGFLRLNDIYNLRLSAELVVLSGCETALGKDLRGEGIIGLTRGFMYAGSPRVVASLWKIDDRATAELMKRFYEGMIGGRRLPPAAALRAAQIDTLRKGSWSHPYYWSAFVIQGEWN